MVYTADLKSASLTGLRVRVPSGALLFTENTMVYVVEWYTHQVVALGPLRTMRVRASSYTLILDDKPPKSSSSQKVLRRRDASENLVNPTYGVVVCECGKCMCNRDVDSKSRRARNCSTTLLSSPQGSHLYVVSDVTKTLQHK